MRRGEKSLRRMELVDQGQEDEAPPAGLRGPERGANRGRGVGS